MDCLVTRVEDHENGLTNCSGQFDGAVVAFYCSTLLRRTGVDETDIFHFNAHLAIETLEGVYINTILESAGGPVVAETERGTVRFIPPFLRF